MNVLFSFIHPSSLYHDCNNAADTDFQKTILEAGIKYD